MSWRQSWTAKFENEFPVSVTTEALTTVSGNTIVVAVACNNFTIANGDVTDSKGNTYVLVGTPVNNNGSGQMGVFYCANITGGASHTITFTRGDASDGTVLAVELGSMLSSSFDVTQRATNQTGATSLSSGSVTTNATDTLIGAFITTAAGTFTAGGSYTKRLEEHTSSNYKVMLETQNAVASGSRSATATFSATTDYGAVFAAFKENTGYTLTSDAGSLTLTGIASVLRVGSTTWLRYRK